MKLCEAFCKIVKIEVIEGAVFKMKYVSLDNGELFSVNVFEDRTDKKFPYYQSGKKFALCPTCGSAVQIIGGVNNNTKNKQRAIFASHTKGVVCGLNYDEEAKRNCPQYEGNRNNWQGIYEVRHITEDNTELLTFIEENLDDLAKQIEDIIGFKCEYVRGKSALFQNIYSSFIENEGLRISKNQFVPEYVARLIVQKAKPVSCWGAIPLKETERIIERNPILRRSLDAGQLKLHNVQIVTTLDNDHNPTNLITKLIIGRNDLENIEVKRVSARA